MTNVAWFGLGYTGKCWLELPKKEEISTRAYSRHTLLSGSELFNAENPEAVRQLDQNLNHLSFDACVVSFPPGSAHPDFWKVLARHIPNRLLFGTTGIYSGTEGIVTEASQADKNHSRYQTETDFMDAGGTVVRLSGIYGPGRHPLNWVNRVQEWYPEKQLNLIQVGDIIRFTELWVRDPERGNLYNLSDGQQHTWGEIAAVGERKGLKMRPFLPENGADRGMGKFISPEKVLKRYPEMTFSNFFEWIENQEVAE